MGQTAFRTEDLVGLLAAVVLHVLLALVLIVQMFFAPDPFVPPPRVAVSLATEVSLESTAPEPVAESRAAIAPTITELPEPPADEATTSEPAAERPTPPQVTRRTATSATRSPRQDRDRSRPDRRPDRPARANRNAGGSRIGDNFLEGRGSSSRTDETRAPAPTFGRRERAALASAITRQLRPHWNAPSGVDAEMLVSTVSWRLNPDGSLKGRPTCRTQAGSITESNRPQSGLHCERAIRAVQLAAPFNLPEQFYSRWDDLEWQFDRRL